MSVCPELASKLMGSLPYALFKPAFVCGSATWLNAAGCGIGLVELILLSGPVAVAFRPACMNRKVTTTMSASVGTMRCLGMKWDRVCITSFPATATFARVSERLGLPVDGSVRMDVDIERWSAGKGQQNRGAVEANL